MELRFGTTHWVSPKFSEDYVRALRNQFYQLDQELTVLGNGEDPDAPLELSGRLPRWFSKLEWFAPWNRDLRPAVVFDLDTFVFHVEHFLSLDPSKLWMIRQFLSRTDLGESGIFLVPSDETLVSQIWAKALAFDQSTGDGPFLRQFPHKFIPDEIPGIYSYKKHCLESCPEDASVVCFHGKPFIPETQGWAKAWWQNSLKSQTKNS